MAQYLSPNIYIEEVPASTQVTAGVTTSAIGMPCWTPQGPTEATLVTSWDQFVRLYGSYTKNSKGAYALAGFFQNAGQRAWITRVAPSDAVSATGSIRNSIVDQVVKVMTGSAVSTISYTESDTPLLVEAGDAPLVPGSLSFRYRKAGTAVSAHPARNRQDNAYLQGTTGIVAYDGRISPNSLKVIAGGASTGTVVYRSVAQDGTALQVAHVVAGNSTPLTVGVLGSTITVNVATDVGGVATSTAADVVAAVNGSVLANPLVSASLLPGSAGGTVVAAAAPGYLAGITSEDAELLVFVPGTFQIAWTSGGPLVGKSISVSATTFPTATGTNLGNSEVVVDLRTGRFSLLASTTELPDDQSPITVSYTPTSSTLTLTSTTVGTFNATTDLTSGTYDAATGAFSLTFTGTSVVPHTHGPVLGSYTNKPWNISAKSTGTWGNDVKVVVNGAADYFTTATQSYSAYNVVVYQKDSVSGQYYPKDNYEALNFDDVDSAQYVAAVVNDLSDLIAIAEPAGNQALQALSGKAVSIVLAGGDASTLTRVLGGTLSTPVGVRTVTISYTDTTGTLRSIVDDGAGALVDAVVGTPSVDTSYTGTTANTVDYTTGVFDVKLKYAVQGGTLVTLSYYVEPAASSVSEDLGSTSLGNTAGVDGTFSDTNWGRAQFTSPALKANYEGLYALNRVDELLQVIVPDFVGDLAITGDILDYVYERSLLNSGGDRFAILGTPSGLTATRAVDWLKNRLNRSSDYAAVYWPWLSVADPLKNNRTKLIPPVGHVAGVYARTDSTRNVGKAPAGTVDGALNGILGLERVVDKSEMDIVYPSKINPIFSSPQVGTAVWGSRTLSTSPNWKNVNARRLFMFVEKSVYESFFWTVFENTGSSTWIRMSAQLGSFLGGLYQRGYFRGATPKEAYSFQIDAGNNPIEVQDAGQIIADVALAPNTPGEFVRFRFSKLISSS